MNVIDKFKQKIISCGISHKPEYGSERFGPAEFNSYFEFLIDRKLAGEESDQPKPEDLWILMKKQVNFFERSLNKASEEYRILENKNREKENFISELIKEIEEKSRP